MKKLAIHIVFLLLPVFLSAQITSPMVRANFGLDADLRHNFFNGSVLAGTDDWFSFNDAGAGVFVIDTTGAASIFSTYTTSAASRLRSFARGMRFPLLSTINGRIYYDASFVRDHRGTDTTGFAGGLKNGQSPQQWSSVVSPVLAKNDITEVFLHVRRNGTNPTDSLFFFGGIGLLGTNGDRYFDFELYQTDISYNPANGQFINAGPDFGHSTWRFNASGQITQLGDIIFTAEYGNAGLSFIEARIWIEKTAITTVNPQAFNWTGSFDGDGNNATYGYAGIVPKTGGNFYQGLQNTGAVWSGPFGNINSSNQPVTAYDPIQFMEFSVNLSRLGLDPMSFTNGSMCNLAFGKVLVKTRTSTSFTASISDFVSPFSFRSVANVDAVADFPIMCPGQVISNLSVRNPLSTSAYTWSTPNGRIVGSAAGTSIVVDQPGIYIVTQVLLNGCGENGRDTVVVNSVNNCSILSSKLISFTAAEAQNSSNLNWRISGNTNVDYIDIERSLNGINFYPINKIAAQGGIETADYSYTDRLTNISQPIIYYRLRIADRNGNSSYSEVVLVKHLFNYALQVRVNPNPVTNNRMQLYITVPDNAAATVQLIHTSGAVVHTQQQLLSKGNNYLSINGNSKWEKGMYILRITTNEATVQQKILIAE